MHLVPLVILVWLHLAFATFIAIQPMAPPFETEKEFLSFCLDPYLKHDLPKPWGNFSFDHPRVLTLARGLAPAILRWGGTDADWSIFYPNKDMPEVNKLRNDQTYHAVHKMRQERRNVNDFIVPIYKADIDGLRKLAKAADGKLLYDLNIQTRKGDDWDPSIAEEIMKYIASSSDEVDDVIFELGNEWPYPIYKPSPSRLSADFVQLNATLAKFPAFKNSYIVGPDMGTVNGLAESFWSPIIKGFVQGAGKFAKAVTIHHYYFKGPGASLSQYFNLTYYNGYGDILKAVRRVMDEAGGQHLPLWVGETSDAYNKGTPGITNRFAGGFLWLDKLGLSAQLGVSLVARQDFYGGNYPFLNEDLQPNPDYWLSFVYKKLVGNRVLLFHNSAQSNYTRLYAHCTAKEANYPPGSVTIFVLNIAEVESLPFYFPSLTIDVYMLAGEGGIVSSSVLMNGERLQLVNDHILPTLRPETRQSTEGLVLPAQTITFIVLPGIHLQDCMP